MRFLGGSKNRQQQSRLSNMRAKSQNKSRSYNPSDTKPSSRQPVRGLVKQVTMDDLNNPYTTAIQLENKPLGTIEPKFQNQAESTSFYLQDPSLTAQQARQLIDEANLAYQQTGRYLAYPEKNVSYSIDTKPGSKPIEYVSFSHTPMADWDWPNVAHKNLDSIQIHHLGDVYDSLQRRIADNPNDKWNLYLTKGGVRGFNVSQQQTPSQFYRNIEENKALRVDPLYARLALAQPGGRGYEQVSPIEGYSSRISGKPGRSLEDEFLAFPIGTVGSGLALPQNLELIHKYHDTPIAQNRLMAGYSSQYLPVSGLELLEKQIDSLPNDPFKAQLINRMYAAAQ